MSRRIYLDLDGVMADFDAHFEALFQRSCKDTPDDEKWPLIYAHGDFFQTMPMCPGAAEFWGRHADRGLIVLTACAKSQYESTARQKRAWVRRHLGAHVTVLPVQGGVNKRLFMHAPGDVLIDDYRRNTEAWEEHGGIAILHRSWEETEKQLGRILWRDMLATASLVPA